MTEHEPEPDRNIEVTQRVEGDPQPAAANSVATPTQAMSHSRIMGSGPVSGFLRASDWQDKLLGEFRLLRRIGGGGMAEVWLAEQTSLRRQVAIKVMRPDIQSDETCRKRFEQEALAAAGLNHPNIVQVYGIGETDGIRYIAQEFVSGMNMRDYIAKKGPPPLSIALHLMKQVAAALQAASEAGIVHRDIKPENILLTKKGLAKVVDFGLAQLTQGGDLRLTQQGTTMGTPLYMSPEQVQGNKVDHRSDLYSLGVTFFHLLTGRPPFRGETAFAVAYHQVHTAPPKVNEIRPDLPTVVCDIVQRLMAKSPDARFSSAQELLAELREIEKRIANGSDLESLPLESTTVSPNGSSMAQPAWRRLISWIDPRQHPRTAFAACALLVWLTASAVGARSANPVRKKVTPIQVRTAKQSDVREQLKLAEQLQTEDAFRAVLVWFPETSPELFVARRELIRLLLPQQRLRDVETLCRETLATQEATPTERAIASIAEATILALQNKMTDADRVFNERVRPSERSIPPEFLAWYREAREQRLQRADGPANIPNGPPGGPDRNGVRRGSPDRRNGDRPDFAPPRRDEREE